MLRYRVHSCSKPRYCIFFLTLLVAGNLQEYLAQQFFILSSACMGSKLWSASPFILKVRRAVSLFCSRHPAWWITHEITKHRVLRNCLNTTLDTGFNLQIVGNRKSWTSRRVIKTMFYVHQSVIRPQSLGVVCHWFRVIFVLPSWTRRLRPRWQGPCSRSKLAYSSRYSYGRSSCASRNTVWSFILPREKNNDGRVLPFIWLSYVDVCRRVRHRWIRRWAAEPLRMGGH